MASRLQELRKKEVINANNGCRIGFVDDLEVDTANARVAALIVYGRPRFFGLFGRGADCLIPWEKIRLIGEDAILVDSFVQKMTNKARNSNNFVTFCNR